MKISAGNHNRWFADRRDLFMKEMIRDFFDTFAIFQNLYGQYMGTEHVSFTEMEKLVGTETDKGVLWRLKDKCHQLWRGADPVEDMDGCLLDWIMGSLFHEAMKLKENIYMHQYYGPLVVKMQEKNAGTVLFCGVECKKFMERTALEIHQQIENLGYMFGRANYLLRTMLPSQAHNDLLIRYLLENEHVPLHLWSETLDDIFADMYGAPEEGFCVAGRSYLKGHWHARGLQAYQEALRLNDRCEEAVKIIADHASFLEKAPTNSDTIP